MSASIQLILNQQISYAVHHLPSGIYNLPDDAGKLAQELLIGLGLITRSAAPPIFPPPPPPPQSTVEEGDAEDSKSDGKDKKARTRTVSKKMKDAFLATGKTEDDLKKVIKAYKAASDADISAAGGDFVAFATHTLAAPSAPAAPKTPEPKKAKAEKAPAAPKKEKKEKGRVAWSAAEKKVFKEVVPDGEVTDELKADFEAFIAAKSDEDFKAFAMAGHMRTWADSKKEPKAGNGEMTPAEYDIARGMQTLSVKGEEEEEEDLEEIEIDGEQLLIGTKTGDIFTPTSSGDIKIGRAGEGKFSSVSIPLTTTQ
jgi:hypothetical protein